jgi:pimeloyl-ACP methyl ester carboxylesterase
MIALGIGLEEYEYPYPVQFLPLTNDLQQVTMAYMDVAPSAEPNGRTVVLFHGKAFGCYYFRTVIEALTRAGYRVVAPDQIGWGKSAKPDMHYSFQLLAANTAALLDHLGVGRVAVLGHSTGGMTVTRFTLMNPDRVTHLVLEDPLGLADYRTGIPPQSEETLYDHERHWTDPKVIRDYVAGYFVHPDLSVWEPLADVLVRVTLSPDYPRWARSAALTFQMIYQQPVRYEYHLISPPTLLIVGAEDHVVPLGQYAQPAEVARLGDFTALSAAAAQDIPRATRVVIPDCGHIPHLEQPSQFLAQLLLFLEEDHAEGLYSAAVPARDSEPGDEAALALCRDRHRRRVLDGPGSRGRDLARRAHAGPGDQRARLGHVH